MSRSKIRYIFFSLLLVALSGCVKQEEFSVVPSLSFKSLNQYKDAAGLDSTLIIYLDYSDGDGDIGLTDADTNGPFKRLQKTYFNLIVEIYEVKNGVKTKLLNPLAVNPPIDYFADTFHFSQRIDNLTPEGKNKSIRGVIDVSINFFVMQVANVKPDSAVFAFQLYDRSLNASKVVETPVLKLDL